MPTREVTVPNGWGGARPGAGRKSRATVERQIARRARIEEIVTDAEWDAIVQTAIDQSKAGDWRARDWVSSYVAGGRPRGELAVEHTVIPRLFDHSATQDWEPPQIAGPQVIDHDPVHHTNGQNHKLIPSR